MSVWPRLRYRTLPDWSEPISDQRDGTSRFSGKAKAEGARRRPVPLQQTESKLLTEAQMVGASDVIIEVELPADAFYSDGTGVKSGRRDPEFPGVVVHLIGTRFGDLRYACDSFDAEYQGDMPGWQANLRAVALGLESLRRVERYGIARRGEQYAGWAALPPGTPLGSTAARPKMTLDRAAAVLAGATDGLVTAPNVLNDVDDARLAYRMAAKRWHPDSIGGSAETWAQVDEAWQLVGDHHQRAS